MTYLNTDGGSRGNPGQSAIAYVIYDENESVVKEGGAKIGVGTNNNAEYQALLLGLVEASKLGFSQIVCRLDSELVVKQLKGEYKVKDSNMKVLFDQVKSLESKFSLVTYMHVERAKNKRADLIVNEYLDGKRK